MDNDAGIIRLDLYISESRGLSRAVAKELIESGKVLIDGKPATKPGLNVTPAMGKVECILPETIYAGRAGYKLEHGLKTFAIDVTGVTCLDIGAATGGFTHCLLHHGAAKVYAVDNGNGQLVEFLRNDSRVISMENTNALDLTPAMFDQPPDMAAIDVSFVSLTKVVGQVMALVKDGGGVVCLVKPQFEVGAKNLTKRGIVKSDKVRMEALERVTDFVSALGAKLMGSCPSPVLGREGNTEYLTYFIVRRKQ